MQDGRQFSLQPTAASLEQPNVAVITHSLDGTIIGWSPAAERMFGYVTAEIIGRSISVLVPADRLEEERAIVQQLRRAQPVEPHQSLRTRKNGQLFPVAITFSLVRDADEVRGVTQSVRDLSWRHESEAVAEREQFANLLLESLPGIVYLYTEDGRFLRWSRSFEVATGYSAAEISSHLRPTDLFEPDYKQLVASRIGEVLRVGVSRVEAPLLSKDGKTTHYHFTGRRVTFHGLTCIVGMGIDISERVRAYEALRKSEERYRTTLESILEGCQLLDFCYRYLYLNDIAAVHNRRPNSELLGRTMLECWPGIEGSQVFRMLKRCMEKRVGDSQEIEFVFPDGSSGWFDVRAQPVPEGLFVLSIDISDRKDAETALRDMNENLERKVIERTSDLKAARERAESADRLKSAFLATMSHELRTPLNSILGFTGILLGGLPGPMNPEQQKQLGMVQNSARHLLALINDVLDVSKIEAGQLELRRSKYDLQSSLERVAVSLKPLAESKGLALRVAISPEIPLLFSDKRRVEQIVLNLLNNAIKFTEDGSITLSAAPGPDGSDVRLRVTDTGLGIKPEDMQALFQPFRQIDAGLERQHEGTGLGLAISRRLTELLGGTIRVESTWGEGSTFEVLLPLQSEGG